jgi:hypothetical protein
MNLSYKVIFAMHDIEIISCCKRVYLNIYFFPGDKGNQGTAGTDGAAGNPGTDGQPGANGLR